MQFIRGVARSIEKARSLVPTFGHQTITTRDRNELMRAAGIFCAIEQIPTKFAAMMYPALNGRLVILGQHVPRSARHLVLLHEAGHRFQGSDALGVTYDYDDWRTATERAADAFAVTAVLPTFVVDSVLTTEIWRATVEDLLADELQFVAGGIWDTDRALAAACARLEIREKLGI